MNINITKNHPVLQEIIIRTVELQRFLDGDTIHAEDRKMIQERMAAIENEYFEEIKSLYSLAKVKKQVLLDRLVEDGVVRRVEKI
jgi:hypothetical protein|tara:strand:+ start:164 stop:418 length:255 start_codon:yes stop_codon:yes gene_type:complete